MRSVSYLLSTAVTIKCPLIEDMGVPKKVPTKSLLGKGGGAFAPQYKRVSWLLLPHLDRPQESLAHNGWNKEADTGQEDTTLEAGDK